MNWLALQDAFARFANRTDLDASLMLQLAEPRIYSGDPINGVEPLRLSSMLRTVSVAPTAGTITIAGMLEVVRVRDAARNVVLRVMSPDDIGAIEGLFGPSYAYDPRAGGLRVAPLSSGALEVHYYARPTTPATGTAENEVMRDHPGIYLHAMLIEAGLYLADDDMTMRALKAWQSAMAGAQAADRRADAGGFAALSIRSDRGVV